MLIETVGAEIMFWAVNSSPVQSTTLTISLYVPCVLSVLLSRTKVASFSFQSSKPRFTIHVKKNMCT